MLELAFRWEFRKDSSGRPNQKKGSGTHTFNAKIYGGGRVRDSRGQLLLYLCTSFIRNSNSEVGGLMLGTKYPQPKFSTESAPRGLRPDSYGSRAPPTTPTSRGTSPGLLREPGSIANISYRTTPPGLLRKPDFAYDFDCRKTLP